MRIHGGNQQACKSRRWLRQHAARPSRIFVNASGLAEEYGQLQNGSDIRGVALEGVDGQNVTLDANRMYCIGAAFAEHLKKQLGTSLNVGNAPRVTVGKDPRKSGDILQSAFAQGLASRAVDCTDIGLATTPACFMSLVMRYGSATAPFDGSVMITASHLPWNRNGAKFFTKIGSLDKSDVSYAPELLFPTCIPTSCKL